MISTARARAIAASWHDGQTSALYALASTGTVTEHAQRELFDTLRKTERHLPSYTAAEARELTALMSYVTAHAPACIECNQTDDEHTADCQAIN